jgi:hypothetical protein
MDRAIYRLITYAAVVLAVFYLYEHLDSIASTVRTSVNNWWR